MAIQEQHESDRSRLAEIERRLERLESPTRLSANDANYFEVREAIERVKANTRELFSDEFTIVEGEDCEIVDDRHIAFRVVDNRPLDTSVQQYQEWHVRLGEIPEGIRGMFRLSIDARP